MTKSPFSFTHALSTLETLFEDLEKNVPTTWEIDIDDTNLTITTEEEAVFLITIHTISGQIWLSSPLSGGHHFTYDDRQNRWISTKQPQTLFCLLAEELEHFYPPFQSELITKE